MIFLVMALVSWTLGWPKMVTIIAAVWGTLELLED